MNINTAALCVGGVITGAALTPIVAPPALGIAGFGAVGPIAGSIAAGVQSSIGNVVAGSLFASVQSVAMGGALPAVGYAASAVTGGIAVAAARLIR